MKYIALTAVALGLLFVAAPQQADACPGSWIKNWETNRLGGIVDAVGEQIVDKARDCAREYVNAWGIDPESPAGQAGVQMSTGSYIYNHYYDGWYVYTGNVMAYLPPGFVGDRNELYNITGQEWHKNYAPADTMNGRTIQECVDVGMNDTHIVGHWWESQGGYTQVPQVLPSDIKGQ